MSHGSACRRWIGVLGHSCTEYTTLPASLPSLACEPVEARRACRRRTGVLGHSCTNEYTKALHCILLPSLACEPVEARRDKACVVEEQSVR